jgi:G3E family GTPase
MRKIPATVVTGFLGAGKTTIIRNMLENANGRRIALIINEFGDVGCRWRNPAKAAAMKCAARTTSSSSPTAASAARWPMTSCPP